jgi:hypothetical protein
VPAGEAGNKAESANKKAGHSGPARKSIFSEVLGPDLLQTPGGWGLRNPVLEGRPGPEATTAFVAFQLGARLSEFGQHYDVIEESVRLRGNRGWRLGVAAAIDVDPASCPRAHTAQSSVKPRSYLEGGAA